MKHCASQSPRVIPLAATAGDKIQDKIKAAFVGASELKVFGTWDFKWPQGTVIKVAFQAPPESELTGGEFDKVKGEVKALAERWLAPLGDKSPNISFNFGVKDMPAPGAIGSAKSGEGPVREYDVLVSLAKLPLVEPGTKKEPERPVFFPKSQLGSYACREDYGVPTVYLGPLQSYQGTLVNYLTTPEFKYSVIHEFGHVLGLAHEHQNPRVVVAWKSAAKIADIIGKATGVKLEVPFVEIDIIHKWPASQIGEEILFSDWREPPPNVGGHPQFNSVMVTPMWRSFLEGEPDDEQPLPDVSTVPTEGDRRQLAVMYPPTGSAVPAATAFKAAR